MQIISFSTEDSDWQAPRMGILLRVNGRDTGFRLDCEKLFDPAELPRDPLAEGVGGIGNPVVHG